jgi:hypothetical protein
MSLKTYIKIGSILSGVICLSLIAIKHPIIVGLVFLSAGIWFIAEYFIPKN